MCCADDNENKVLRDGGRENIGGVQREVLNRAKGGLGGSSSLGTGPENWGRWELLRSIRLVFFAARKIHGNFHFHKLLTPILPCSLVPNELARVSTREHRCQGPRAQLTSELPTSPMSPLSIAGWLPSSGMVT